MQKVCNKCVESIGCQKCRNSNSLIHLKAIASFLVADKFTQRRTLTVLSQSNGAIRDGEWLDKREINLVGTKRYAHCSLLPTCEI